MKDIARLAQSLMELDDQLSVCMKCGMCQAVCPVYGTTMFEGDVSRGKLALLKNLAYKIIEDPDAVSEKLNRCLLCGNCQANCPSGVSNLDIFFKARAIIAEYKGLAPLKKLIFHQLLPNPRLFNFLTRVGAPMSKIIMRPDKTTQGTVHAPLLNHFLGDRHIPQMSLNPLRARVGKLDIKRGKSKYKVAFFPGCMADKMYPDMGQACIKVLLYHGVGIFMPDTYACCGIPALVSGDTKGYGEMVMQNVDFLRKGEFDYIVTPCSSCTATIKEFWPKYREAAGIPSSYQASLDDFSKKAIDINAFLVDVLGVKASGHPQGGTKVTYHESCHLRLSLGVSAQPRELIRMNPNYELVEMNEATRCCGCGGSFTLTQKELSAQIGQRKRDNVVASGAAVVATGCPACMMQLSDMLARNNDNIKVKHVIEIYAESL